MPLYDCKVIPGSIIELLVWFLYSMSHKEYSEPYTPTESTDPNYVFAWCMWEEQGY